MIIQVDEISICPISMEHVVEEYVTWLNDPEVNSFLEIRHKSHTLSSLHSDIESFLGNDSLYFFAVNDEEGNFVGTVKLSDIKPMHKTAVISFMIGDKNTWGRGIATKAVYGLCYFAFDQLKMAKLKAGCYAANNGSKGVLTKVGFLLEGQFRQQVIYEENRHDVLDFGICRDEFNFKTFKTVLKI